MQSCGTGFPAPTPAAVPFHAPLSRNCEFRFQVFCLSVREAGSQRWCLGVCPIPCSIPECPLYSHLLSVNRQAENHSGGFRILLLVLSAEAVRHSAVFLSGSSTLNNRGEFHQGAFGLVCRLHSTSCFQPLLPIFILSCDHHSWVVDKKATIRNLRV